MAQVWRTPVRHDRFTETSQASANSSSPWYEGLHGTSKPRNVTAQIWWTKCRMRWKEPPAAVELSGRVDGTMEVVHARERVTRKLDTLADRGSVS
jgi:hypothetical protein